MRRGPRSGSRWVCSGCIACKQSARPRRDRANFRRARHAPPEALLPPLRLCGGGSPPAHLASVAGRERPDSSRQARSACTRGAAPTRDRSGSGVGDVAPALRALAGVAEGPGGAALLHSSPHAAAGSGARGGRKAARLCFCFARRCRFFSLLGSLTLTLTSRPCRVRATPVASAACAEADWAKTILPHPAWLSPRGSGASQASSTEPNRP